MDRKGVCIPEGVKMLAEMFGAAATEGEWSLSEQIEDLSKDPNDKENKGSQKLPFWVEKARKKQ